VDQRVGLDDAQKRKFLTLPGLELQLLGRPARSQSLYRLRYPGSQNQLLTKLNSVALVRKRAIPTERPPLSAK
jgi:hypothetical protein